VGPLVQGVVCPSQDVHGAWQPANRVSDAGQGQRSGA